MKTNEAPEKIYCESDGLGNIVKVHNIKWPDDEAENIEYTRADAFIKKTKEAFCKATCNGHPPRSTCTSLGTCKEYDNFVKYIKGE